MKAYVVSDREGYAEYVIVVFAESRGKAMPYALGTDEFQTCDWDFTQLRATRIPSLDKYYRGKWRMEWDDDEDCLAMVKDAGFYCAEDVFDPDFCERCAGKEYGTRYEEYLEEREEEE